MNFFKVFMLLNMLTAELSKAMEDNYLTIEEVLDITDKLLTSVTGGKSFRDIGIRIYKKDGKTRMELVI